MEFIDENLSRYALDHTSHESELLKRIERETNLEVLRPRMLSGSLQGRLLAVIARMVHPDYIVEVGTYTGYSALCLAEGLSENGKLVTIEKNVELEDRIRGYFSESVHSGKLDLRIGDAAVILAELEDGINLAFIDADKPNYQQYYELLLAKVRSGGIILADNVLWSGKVIQPVKEDDIDTISLQKFNSFVQADNRVENILLPVRDGLMIIRKK